MTEQEALPRRRRAALSISLAVVTAAGLAVDAVIHLDLAPGYQLAAPGGVGGGTVFRLEAAAAIVAAVAVLVRPGRLTWSAAFLVAFGGLAAVLLYRYVDVPAFGPMPAMYEPVWYPEKSWSAVAEAVAASAALAGLLGSRRPSAP